MSAAYINEAADKHVETQRQSVRKFRPVCSSFERAVCIEAECAPDPLTCSEGTAYTAGRAVYCATSTLLWGPAIVSNRECNAPRMSEV